MDTARPSSRAGNQQNNANVNPSFTPRPRATSEDTPRHNFNNSGPPRHSEENRSPATAMPKAFQGMLRNTTETGDIGMFSIKPSRIPQALNSPRSNSMSYVEKTQKPRHNFQPYGVPVIDDRRRLPSYNRDTTSEVIAMYGSPNLRPGNRPEDSDNRSYSMGQASSYALANHRSFASLRNQQQGDDALLQRPRSPFAYPTRLRRPGVRPSSPALTDGGLVDYSRRTEIERFPHGPGNSTASPGSLYAQKRRPPGPYYQRSEANRSTPSLLSQQSPPRHSSNPNLRQSVSSQGEWQRKPFPQSGTTSPARSTLSRTSTTNLYVNTGGPASTTTTPGKLHPPSPLYYDYTEDFDVDDYNQPEPLPPPTFRMAPSIPEDEPATSDFPAARTPSAESKIPVSTSRPPLRSSASATSVLQRSYGSNASHGTMETNISAFTPFNEREEILEEELGVKLVDSKRDTRIIKPSGLGLGARELSTHVEETFGLPSSPSSNAQTPDEFEDAHQSQISADEETSILRSAYGTLSRRSSAFSLGTHLQQFPKPPNHQEILSTNEMEDTGDFCDVPDALSHHSRSSASVQIARMEIHPEETEHLPSQKSRGSKRASMVDSLDMGFEELDKLVLPPFDGTNVLQSLPNGLSGGSRPERLSKLSQKTPSGPKERGVQENTQPQFRARYDGARSGSAHSQQQAPNHSEEENSSDEIVSVHMRLDMGNVPKFSHQGPNQLLPRPESPMIAPKPISPARQLRLRNSIPQIMKTLPPLPQDPPVRAGLLMNKLPSFEPEHQISPVVVEKSVPMREPQKTPQPPISSGEDMIAIPEKSPMRRTAKPEVSYAVEEKKSISEATLSSAPPLPRLKLKTRASSSRPLSPPDVRPWNMAESYPWSNQNLDVGLPHMDTEEEPLIAPLPKFRLKVTRASNSSTHGTMIVNREPSESKGVGTVPLKTPKDLFTPPSGLENIFRQVGKHLHTRTSESRDRSETESPVHVIPAVNKTAIVQTEDVIKPKIQQNPVPVTPAVHHRHVAQSSFSDDSSHIEHRQKLRTRLSNLKARLPFNYGYRTAAHSSDNIIWERRSEDPRTPHILQSAPNLHANSATVGARTEPKIPDEKIQLPVGRLRGKVRGWLKGAKTAFVGHKRSRSSLSKKSDDERAQLTVFD